MKIYLILALCCLVLTEVFAILSVTGKTNKHKAGFALLAIIFSALYGLSISEYVHSKEPSAIDVYRGNTELSITQTIKNGVVVKTDSTVVFKIIK